MIMERPPRTESALENIQKIKALRSYLEAGYVLHGSKHKVTALEPRQSNDNDPKRVIGKAFAIYATNSDIRIPIFMALKDGYGESSYSIHGGPEGIMKIRGERGIFLSKGYVYVLPKTTFEEESDEHGRELISRSPVTPVDVIEVDPSILNHLENINSQIGSRTT